MILRTLRRAAWVYAGAFLILAAAYGVGFAAGAFGWLNYTDVRRSSVVQFSRELEYRVPGYGALLKSYRTWHVEARNRYFFSGDRAALRRSIFLNNAGMASLTQAIRGALILPAPLFALEKFYQGVVFATAPGSARMTAVFLFEFGGYFLTWCAALILVVWVLFPTYCGYPGRRQALAGGATLLGLAYLAALLLLALGAWLEADEAMRMLGR